MSAKITIFTPTYNRAYILGTLYESLKRQTSMDFKWIIVNDGSTDNTDQLVNTWLSENNFQIIYYKQNNSGKHIAINSGVNLCDTELFFCVDSDDYLTDDAIEKVLTLWRDKGENKGHISGIVALRKYHNNSIIGTPFPKYLETSTLGDLYKKHSVTGDKVVIYKTEVLKKFPFPQFAGEKFLVESLIYDRIDREYNMLLLNNAIYYCEYLPDGLSQDFRELYRKNPRGFLEYFNQSFVLSNALIEKGKCAAHYFALSLYLKNYNNFVKTQFLLYFLPIFPASLYLFLKIFILKKSDVKAFKN